LVNRIRTLGAGLHSLMNKFGLPVHAVSVGAGLVIFGGGSYLYLASAARALLPQEFGAISGLWLLINVLGIGLFLPLEQELARALATRRAAGFGGRPVLGRVTVLGLAGVAALGLLAWPFTGLIVDRALAGQPQLLVALWLGVVGYAFAFIQRGAFAGTSEFGAYGWQLTCDGLVRAVGAPILLLAGVHSVLTYAVLLGLAPWVSIVCTSRALRPSMVPGPRPAWAEVAHALAFLVVASFGSLAVGNGAALVVTVISGHDDPALVGRVVSGAALARLPAFMFVAVQAVFLPGLARMAELGEWRRFRSSVTRLCLLATGLTLVAAAVVALSGSGLVTLVFGGANALGNGPLVLLTVGSGLSIVAAIVGQALVVLQRYRTAALAWAVGLGAVAVTAMLPFGSPLARGLVAFVAGMTVATAWLVVETVRGVRRRTSEPDTAPAVQRQT
jgi:O-antigen/teichoic acid export membrane protein